MSAMPCIAKRIGSVVALVAVLAALCSIGDQARYRGVVGTSATRIAAYSSRGGFKLDMFSWKESAAQVDARATKLLDSAKGWTKTGDLEATGVVSFTRKARVSFFRFPTWIRALPFHRYDPVRTDSVTIWAARGVPGSGGVTRTSGKLGEAWTTVEIAEDEISGCELRGKGFDASLTLTVL